MRQAYRSPALAEYGRIHEITMGAGGDKPDAIVQLGPPLVISVDPDDSTCFNNVPSGYCYTIVG